MIKIITTLGNGKGYELEEGVLNDIIKKSKYKSVCDYTLKLDQENNTIEIWWDSYWTMKDLITNKEIEKFNNFENLLKDNIKK